jgi:hypothetical protein
MTNIPWSASVFSVSWKCFFNALLAWTGTLKRRWTVVTEFLGAPNRAWAYSNPFQMKANAFGSSMILYFSNHVDAPWAEGEKANEYWTKRQAPHRATFLRKPIPWQK